MVKLAGPCMSLKASGSLAKTVTFATWKGRPYARQLVIPDNPRSGGQVGMRSMFKFLSQIWLGLTDANKATWEDRADTMVASPFNAFMSYIQKRWRDFKAPSVDDPAVELSTPAVLATGVATPVERMMQIVITDGATPPDFAYALFRSITATFTLAWANCIAVIPYDVAGTTNYVDSPLEPGTYYYNTIGFNDDGIKGADGTEFDGEIT